MAAARSERYLDHGRTREKPSGRAIPGLSRAIHAAGLQLAGERPGGSPAVSRAWGIPPHAMKADCSSLIRSDRERPDRDDVAIGVTLGAIGERAIDRGLFGGRLQSKSRPASRAHGNRVPAAGRFGDPAGDIVACFGADHPVAGSLEESGDPQQGRAWKHATLIERDARSGAAAEGAAWSRVPTSR